MAVSFHRLAIREFIAARRRYAQLPDDTEARFVESVRAAVTRIEANPLLGSLFRGTYRWVRTRQFPYVLYYEPAGPGVEIVYAIAHGRRRPNYWIRRVRRA